MKFNPPLIPGALPRWLARAPMTIFVSIASVLAFASTSLSELMEFRVDEFIAGQCWRLLTGHWTHFSTSHFLWDVAVFAILGVLCEAHSRRATWVTLITSALLIPLAATCTTGLCVYRGLSGLDTALFALLATTWLCESLRERDWRTGLIPAVMLGGMFAKVAWEWLSGGSLFVNSTADNFTPVPLAHLIGAAVGFGVSFYYALSNRRRLQRPHRRTALA